MLNSRWNRMRSTRCSHRVRATWRRLVETARLCCGVPDYDRYVRHFQEQHPERPVPDYAAFFRERQRARYDGGRHGCC